MQIHKVLIGIVGPCGSGKSTLAATLNNHGYTCRHIAQEHSYVKDMWKRITNPDVLIFLQASYQVCTERRQLNWKLSEYLEQQHRLSDALNHANLIINTDNIDPKAVAQLVMDYLNVN